MPAPPPLSASSLFILPSTFSPHPHPLHIGEFPLIRILRANPPQLLFPQRINVLTLGEENNRLRGGKTKGLFVADVLFWILELVFCLSRHRSLSLLFLWLRQTVACPFRLPCVSSLACPRFSLSPRALISHYQIRHPCTYTPLTTYEFVFFFPLYKFLNLTEDNAVHPTELSLTANISNFCRKQTRVP